jgi:cytoskeletal protein RodZ
LERLGSGRARITVSVVRITVIRVAIVHAAIVGIAVVGIAVVWGWIRIVGITRIIPPPRIAEAIEAKARTEKTPAVVKPMTVTTPSNATVTTPRTAVVTTPSTAAVTVTTPSAATVTTPSTATVTGSTARAPVSNSNGS